MSGHYNAAMWSNALPAVGSLLAQSQAGSSQAQSSQSQSQSLNQFQLPSQSQSPQSIFQQPLQPTRSSPSAGGPSHVAGPSSGLARPLLPRRAMSAPRVPLARDKPYARRKSSAQTFTNAHELALWDSKRRSSTNSAGFPAVQMTAIPMVKDYLLPSQHDARTPPPLSPSHSLPPAQHQQHQQHHQRAQQHLQQLRAQAMQPRAAAPGAMLRLGSSSPEVMLGAAASASASASASCAGAVADGVQGLALPQNLLGTSASRQNQTQSQSQSHITSRQAAARPCASTQLGVHMQRSLSIPTLPSAASSSMGMGVGMQIGTAVQPVHNSALRGQTASPAGRSLDTQCAPLTGLSCSPVANPEPQWPQDVANNSVAPFTPYGPYPSGQCVWYYYDPDKSPMPPPPVPGSAATAQATPAMRQATAASSANVVNGASVANSTNVVNSVNVVNGANGVNSANSINTANGVHGLSSVQAASTCNPNPNPTATDGPDPFPGALADAKGWFLLDLKTNLPFYVPFDPNDETPDGGAGMASKRGAHVAARLGKLPSPATTIPLAQAQSLQAELAGPAVSPAVSATRHSPAASTQHTSPLTLLTPSDPDSPLSVDDVVAPDISPALFYPDPAHMSALFKRRQGALFAVSK